MRIISPKFHDYYDKAMAEGQDRSLVFIREPVEYAHARDIKDLPPALRTFTDLARSHTPDSIRLNQVPGFFSVEVDFGLIWFAGKLYPWAEVTRRPMDSFTTPTRVLCHQRADLAQLLREVDYDVEEKDKRDASWGVGWGGHRATTGDFFKLAGDERLMETALIHRVAVATWSRAFDMLHVNNKLANLQFYKRLDAWQAFQELSMFFGNIAAPDRVPVTIEDKHRIAQHGFDKWSFRKMPQTSR